MRILLRLAYDGTDFCGCGPLPGVRTVIGTLCEALARVDLEPVSAEALSRTDAGVHARGNLAHVVLPRERPPVRILGALDRHLPADLRAVDLMVVSEPPVAGPKTYTYRLDLSPHGDPFLARTAWRLPGSVAADVLPALAAACVGPLDFTPFRRSGETRNDLVRTIHDARWDLDECVATLTITGSGFPYRGVRSLVGAMVLVARGSASQDDFLAALAGSAGPVTRQTAPAHGLCLETVAVSGV